MKRFAVFDIDGTVIRWQLYHAVVEALIKQGSLSEEVRKAIHDARMTWKRRDHSQSFGEYEMVLVRAYEAALTTLSVDAFNQAIETVFDEYKDQVYTYTRDLIRDLQQQDYLLFAISGSYQEIVNKLASHYGFDDVVGQVYEQKDGRFTGNHTMPMKQKDAVLQQLVTKHGATFEGSVAVGDSEGDIAMLEIVQRPIAFNPTSGLMAHAQKHSWEIVVERKNVVYQLRDNNGSYLLAKTD